MVATLYKDCEPATCRGSKVINTKLSKPRCRQREKAFDADKDSTPRAKELDQATTATMFVNINTTTPPVSSKAILGIGLTSGPGHDEESIRRSIAEQRALALEAGFDVVACTFDPSTSPTTVAGLIRDKVRERQWDGVMLGFGIRGNPAVTELFEVAVNICVHEMRPAPRFAFNVTPTTAVEAIVRSFSTEMTALL